MSGLLAVLIGTSGAALADAGAADGAKTPAGATGESARPRAVPHPSAEQLSEFGDGGERLGDVALGARAARNAARHVVVVDDEQALDAALALIVGDPADVWRDALVGFAADLDADEVAALDALPGVSSVEADRPVRAMVDQPNPPWGLDRIDQRNRPIDNRYATSATGAGVKAYVIDSGLWLSHDEFAGRVADGAWFDFGDNTGVWDCEGHGTHVAGTVGGTTYGVAKQVTIVPVKVLDCDGSGPLSAVIGGLEWVAANHLAGEPAVANMSLGLSAQPGTEAVDAAVAGLVADGVTVVVAAGNDTAPACGFSPARVPAAITVAASDTFDDDASFSNFGACNDIFAPGVDILSAWPSPTDDSTEIESGTSMASPHVAGAAALILQSAPWATPTQVWASLDAASTMGVMTECCGDPDKLLFITPASIPPPPPVLTSLSPARLLETRAGLPTVDGQFAGNGRRPAGSVLELPVVGRAGVPR